MDRVRLVVDLQMAKPIPDSDAISSGTVIVVFNNGRRLSLDFFLTGTTVEGNKYILDLDDVNTAWLLFPEDECDEEGIGSFEASDFKGVKKVEELFLCSEDAFVPGQTILHASAVIEDGNGEVLCKLSDKEFADTVFGEFYPNEIRSENAKELVDEGVNDIILKYQEKFGIADGSIDPLMSLELDEIEEKLADFLNKAFPIPV